MKKRLCLLSILLLIVAIVISAIACAEMDPGVADDATRMTQLKKEVGKSFENLTSLKDLTVDLETNSISCLVENETSEIDFSSVRIASATITIDGKSLRSISLEEGENTFTVRATRGSITVTLSLIITRKAVSPIEPAHTHTYSDEWSSDTMHHWHAATCEHATEIKDKAAHTFGDWVTDGAPDYVSTGAKHRTCSVCSYVQIEVIPKLEKEPSTISFDLNGGIASSALTPVSVTELSAEYFSFDIEKEGQHFRGWSYRDILVFDETGTQLSSPEMAAEMTFVAVFSQTVKLHIATNMPEAGTISGNGEYAYDSEVEVSAHANQGYEFVCWVYSNAVISNQENYRYRMWDHDVTITARFRLADFTLSLASNNAENGLVIIDPTGENDEYGAQCEKDVTYTNKVTVAAYTTAGTRFLGWFDENNVLVTTNAVLSFSMPNHDYSLIAKWDYFAIHYELNGGTNDEKNPISYSSESADIVFVAPKRGGYTFGGWYTDAEFNHSITGIPSGNYENVTVYAKWTILPELSNFKFTYDNNVCTITGVKDKTVTSAVVPDYVTNISAGAFSGCTSLITLTIPFVGATAGKTAKDTYQYPFGYIFGTKSYSKGTAVSQTYYGSSKNTLTSSTYYIPSSLRAVMVTGGNILYGAFYGCSMLTSVTMENGVKSIGEKAFYYCSKLTSAKVGNGVKSIGSGAFTGCSALETMTIPFVGGTAGKSSTDTYQYPFGYIFGTSDYSGGTAVGQNYYGSSTSDTTYSRYIIPSKLRTVTVTGGNILRGAFYGCSGLTSITLPDKLKSIMPYAFYGCYGLSSISIPASVTSIGGSAFRACRNLAAITIPEEVKVINPHVFYGCSKLTSITIPKNVTSIGKYAFYDCSGLTSVSIPNTVTSIGDYAFGHCERIPSIDIPNSVTKIGSRAFYYCRKLTSSTIPNGVTRIENGTFYYCDSLCTVDIPNSVTSIGSDVFSHCRELTSVSIPNSVKSIGSAAFSGCSSLKRMTIPFVGGSADKTASSTYQYPFGYIFGTNYYTGANNVTQYYYGYSKSSLTYTTYRIPSSLRTVKVTGGNILYGAFYGCTMLRTVTIGVNATSIGTNAFYGCSGLTTMTIGSSVKSIGSGAFSGCSSLESMTIPFVGATAGKTANDTYQYPFGYIFGTSRYSNSTAVKQYYYGSSTSKATSNTYWIPSSLSTVTVTGGNILRGAFYGCSTLASITLPANLKSIKQFAFFRCLGLKSITVPDSVTSIGGSAFYECTSLTSVSLSKKLKNVSANAFYRCTALTSIEIPSSVTSIEHDAFDRCSGLTSVMFAEGSQLTSIKYSAFDHCSGLTSLTIPASVTNIGALAFNGCDGLASLSVEEGNSVYHSAGNCVIKTLGKIVELGCKNSTIPTDGSVTHIGSYAFSHCSGLTAITIPSTVTKIDNYAFSHCSGLTSVTFAVDNHLTSIGSSAFYSCKDLISITIPASVTIIGDGAFSNCSGLTSITVEEGNSVYHSAGNCLIETSSKTLLKGCNNSVIPTDGSVTSIGSSAFSGYTGFTSLTIPASVTNIKEFALSNCSNLTSITIPASVTNIESYALYFCSKLTSITFQGTKAQWNAITKDTNWNYGTGKYTIYCTNGNISKS